MNSEKEEPTPRSSNFRRRSQIHRMCLGSDPISVVYGLAFKSFVCCRRRRRRARGLRLGWLLGIGTWADWQALVVAAPDTVDGLFVDSLIIFCFCLLQVKHSQEKSPQETCHPLCGPKMSARHCVATGCSERMPWRIACDSSQFGISRR